MAVSTPPRPTVTPLMSWDKAQQQAKPAPKKSNTMFIILAAVILLAAIGMFRMFNKPPAGQWVQVMAAKSDIQVGSRIGITNIRFLDVPKQFFSKDMVVSLNDATGRVSRTFIPAGEPIKDYMLFDGHGGLSGHLASNERAITLQLDDDSLVDHAIMPDDRIDLMVLSSKGDNKFTKTIAQALRVLMTSPKDQIAARRGGTAGNKITLAVAPDLAEIINEAAETGKIRAILRSSISRSQQELTGAGPDTLLPAIAAEDNKNRVLSSELANDTTMQLPPPPPAMPAEIPAAQPPGPVEWMVEVISGSHREVYAVPTK